MEPVLAPDFICGVNTWPSVTSAGLVYLVPRIVAVVSMAETMFIYFESNGD